MRNETGNCIYMIWAQITIQYNTALHMVPSIDSHIVLTLTLTLVEKQRTAFPRQKLVAHISGGLPLPSTDRYDVTSGAKLKIMAVSKFSQVAFIL